MSSVLVRAVVWDNKFAAEMAASPKKTQLPTILYGGGDAIIYTVYIYSVYIC